MVSGLTEGRRVCPPISLGQGPTGLVGAHVPHTVEGAPNCFRGPKQLPEGAHGMKSKTIYRGTMCQGHFGTLAGPGFG